MSPRKMFQSWGSSSIAVARRVRPMRVTRGSFSPGLLRAEEAVRVRHHRPELQHSELPATASHAPVAEEHRAAVLQLHERTRSRPRAAASRAGPPRPARCPGLAWPRAGAPATQARLVDHRAEHPVVGGDGDRPVVQGGRRRAVRGEPLAQRRVVDRAAGSRSASASGSLRGHHEPRPIPLGQTRGLPVGPRPPRRRAGTTPGSRRACWAR